MPILNKLRPALPWGSRGGRTPAALSRLRLTLTLFFALDGFLFAGWVVRIPAIKEQTGASASALGLALLGVSAGGVVTMMLTGRLCRRFGSLPVTVGSAALMSASVALPPLAPDALALGLVLLVFGAAYGAMNVSLNSAAVELVAALGRPVMPAFHAAYSLGGMAGAGLGALVAGGLSPTWHLLPLAAVGLVATVVTGRALLGRRMPLTPSAPSTRSTASGRTDAGGDGTERPRDGESQGRESKGGGSSAAPSDDGRSGSGRSGSRRSGGGHTGETSSVTRPRRTEARPRPPKGRSRGFVLLCGVIALCTAYGEGAMADWGALHLEEDLDARPGVAALGYSLFALAMTVGRLSGTFLLERLGHTRTLVAGGATAAAGMLLGALAPSVWAALLGFGVAGLGLANIFPVAVARAGAVAGPGGVAATATLGYGGMLLGPPVIGFLADWSTLPIALTTVAALAAGAALIAYAARDVASEEQPLPA
ncbi:MFS transporter [Streptomyces sp. NPDC004726]